MGVLRIQTENTNFDAAFYNAIITQNDNTSTQQYNATNMHDDESIFAPTAACRDNILLRISVFADIQLSGVCGNLLLLDRNMNIHTPARTDTQPHFNTSLIIYQP